MKLKTSYVLIAFAALAQGVMWVNVFKLLHPGVMAYIGGIPAGLAIVGLIARSANVLPGKNIGKQSKRAGWILLALLVGVEPVVLGVANYMAMTEKSWIVAGGASLVVTLALILGSVVDRSLVPVEKPATKRVKQEKKLIKPEPEPAKPAFICSCGRSFGSQAALNGHQSAHKPKGYAVEFTPITKGVNTQK